MHNQTEEQTLGVDKILYHPSYNKDNYIADIALIRMTNPVYLRTIVKIVTDTVYTTVEEHHGQKIWYIDWERSVLSVKQMVEDAALLVEKQILYSRDSCPTQVDSK